MWGRVPRGIVVVGIIAAAIEIGHRLPDIVLIPQRVGALVGEYGAKSLQPQVVETQIAKTQADTRLAETQAELNAVQQQKLAAETKLAQVQAALTAEQAAKTRAEAQLAQAQTAKTQVETAQSSVGLAMTLGILALGAKAIGALDHSGDTQQAAQEAPQQPPPADQPASAASPFEAGRADWHRWHDWEQGLGGDALAGMRFWADVRNKRQGASCVDGGRADSADFMNACETAKRFLAAVDQARRSSPDYRQGWNAGARETGDL